MKKFGLAAIALAALTAGCASNTKQDNFREASFELCNTEVDIYSVSDDGRVRIVCSDGSKFALTDESTLETMRDINIDYCDGEGLGKFNESSKYYSFKCKSGTLLSLPK
ncbi:hypothetical protein L1D54_13485 [Vibrio brasiliensis]|jgi:hypothetical protein|uniref:Lipoprotein n=1 Tax=Vibrio brasiliensis LMG 20546 TaxID=945543 RepID=E8M0P4_9VIBR|nr:hypothetical protein [Vibrio brasiliensis]EGA63569.1 hypothetical protein VIBR0546_09764 [Vibrio brasiliensis LMG 20546]MCG9649902.1 hypothetical protein [Vibrio brasiliensis]MCG9726064.1 hypothetical protein [Vibrio brasiliensis]MCG9751498.1 hypothetical protein [Vibrio brasiliensis]MCG9781006.1 hypothetical protein [Vibrio brasiliensis]